jgi:hypothetical protein
MLELGIIMIAAKKYPMKIPRHALANLGSSLIWQNVLAGIASSLLRTCPSS